MKRVDRTTMSYIKQSPMNRRLKRFLETLLLFTDVNNADLHEIMKGANVQIKDWGRFYHLLAHEILTCQRKRLKGIDFECESCDSVFNQYYQAVTYGKGSSHKSWRDQDYPQYRVSKHGFVLVNILNPAEVSTKYDLIIGLRMDKDDTLCTWFQFEAARGHDFLNDYNSLQRLDNETAVNKIIGMTSFGHTVSSLRYARTRLNQGPFGSSKRNDSNPIRLNLKRSGGAEVPPHFTPIRESDSINFDGYTPCD